MGDSDLIAYDLDVSERGRRLSRFRGATTASGSIRLVGAVYDLTTGEVTFLANPNEPK